MFGYAFDLLWRWIVTTLAILMVPSLVTSVEVDGLGTALAAAAILGVLNVVLRPLLILLTLPLTFLSFGIFLLFINAFLFQVAGWMVTGMVVKSFGGAFFASLIITVVSWVLSWRWPWDRRPGPQVFVRTGGWQTGPRPRPTQHTRSSDGALDLEEKNGKWE